MYFQNSGSSSKNMYGKYYYIHLNYIFDNLQ